MVMPRRKSVRTMARLVSFIFAALEIGSGGPIADGRKCSMKTQYHSGRFCTRQHLKSELVDKSQRSLLEKSRTIDGCVDASAPNRAMV